MKKVVITLFAAILAFNLSAQESTFEKGDKALNLGLGFGSFLGASGYKTTIPPISASFEVGIIDGILDKATVGVGGYLGFAGSKDEIPWFGDEYYVKYTYIVIGARGTFHYPLVDKLDTYGGVMLGYTIVSNSTNLPSTFGTYSYTANSFTPSFFVGGRYYFTDNFAAMAELGYGVALLNLGVALKF
ncbi:MAG: hypothetical protein IPN08_09850 [Bacteroidales bacterium]|nr:hypothetical protein [Bacteroidales bacterium]MBK9357672.1 hypothetical protein [Bacteroidales bacterium]